MYIAPIHLFEAFDSWHFSMVFISGNKTMKSSNKIHGKKFNRIVESWMLRLILVPTQYAAVGSEFTCKWYCFHLKPVSYHFERPVFKSIMWSPCARLIFFSSFLLHHFIYFMGVIDTYEIRIRCSPLVISALIILQTFHFIFVLNQTYQVNGKVVFHRACKQQLRDQDFINKFFVSI